GPSRRALENARAAGALTSASGPLRLGRPQDGGGGARGRAGGRRKLAPRPGLVATQRALAASLRRERPLESAHRLRARLHPVAAGAPRQADKQDPAPRAAFGAARAP